MLLEKLMENVRGRQEWLRADRNKHTYMLREVDLEPHLISAVGRILQGLQKKATLVEVCVGVGKRIQTSLRLGNDTVQATQLGWFIVLAFIELGLVSYELQRVNKARRRTRTGKYQHYILQPRNIRELEKLWEELREQVVDLFPSGSPMGQWESNRHPLGHPLIKKASQSTLRHFSPERQPLVFESLNKLGNQGWRVNPHVMWAVQELKKNREGTILDFADEEPHKRFSKELELDYTLRIAELQGDRVFYHLYNMDFRGRTYCNTAYLQEQSSDLAKGLLLFAEPTPLGPHGFKWLLIHAANCMGQEKETLPDRQAWAREHLNDLLAWGAEPLNNRGWMEYKDTAWSLLAVSVELYLALRVWNGALEDFISSLPVYIDGTVSGTQHLVALSRDEVLAPYVNLVPQDQVGDLYLYIADLVWEEIEKEYNDLDQGTINGEALQKIIDYSNSLQRKYNEAPEGSEERYMIYQELATWRNHTRALRDKLSSLFWLGVQEKAHRRKAIKRNAMTLGYGATLYGFIQQQIDDSPRISPYIASGEHLWYVYLGKLTYRVCHENLGRVAELLALFETLADRANERQEDLEWVVPITNFWVKHNYRNPTIKRTKLLHSGVELKVNLEAWEETRLNTKAQRLAASPNIVHSLDAAHLTMTVADTPYPIAVIHDSFGCSAGNMQDLFRRVRENFVRLYETDPLRYLLAQLDSMDLMPSRGTYNVRCIMESDFAFS